MLKGLLKKTQGTISLFMAIIMLANFVLSAVIVEGARYRMAKEMVQSAADSAAMSVIAKYDLDLYDRYGLFAIDVEPEKLQKDFMDFFTTNLMAKLPEEDSLNELFTKLEAQFGLEKINAKESFDLYDFQVNEANSKVEPVYSVGNPTILQMQMTEFAKYRSATRLIQDLTGWGGKIQEGAEQQKSDLNIIGGSLDYKESISNVSEELALFTKKLSVFYMGDDNEDTINDTKNNKNKDALELRENLNTDADALISAIDEFNEAVSKTDAAYLDLDSKIDAYNTKVDSIVEKENELRSQAESIQFDDTATDYNQDIVTEWESKKNEVDELVSEISTYNFTDSISVYNTEKTKINKNKINNAVNTLKTLLNGWKTDINLYISEFNEIANRAESAKTQAQDYKNSLSSKSGDVKTSAVQEVNENLSPLNVSLDKNGNGQYNAVIYMNNTIADINAMLDILDEIKTKVSNVGINDLRANFYIYYTDNVNKYDNKGGISYTSTYCKTQSTSQTGPLENRVEWNQLLKISKDGLIKPEITNNCMNEIRTKTVNLKNHKLRGYHYIYESNIQKSEGTSGYNDLKNETGLDIKTLKNKYKSKNSVSEETGDKGKDDSLTKELSKEVFAYLPSQNRNDFALANYDASDIAFFSGDFKNQLDSNTIFNTQELDDSNDSDAVASLTSMKLGGSTDDQKTTFSLMSNFLDELSGWFVNAQYDIVSFSYIMSMFNTRMTRSSDFVKIENGKAKAVKNPTEAEKNKKSYVDRDPSNDLDLKFRTKALNETILDAEIEYLIVGDRHDKTNANTVWASIYGIRLINNFVAMYSDRDIRITVKSISAEIAAAIAAITFGAGTMLAPVIELAIMMILAATETYMDMVKLVNEGKKIPLIKSKKNLIIKGKDDNEDGFFVSYEDYLMIMLIFTGKTNLLYRTGDLIQMNGYDLRKKYTYVRCANEVSIKPLMISYAFVPDQIKNGHTNRKAFRTLIYQGY